MPQIQILKVIPKDIHLTRITTFLLLDEQQQKILALNLRERMQVGPMRNSSPQDASMMEPLTIDFLTNVLHALGGTIEEIALTALPDNRLYAQVHLRDQQGLNTVAARLDDALLLARRENCKISAAQEILERNAVDLANYGATRQEQIAAVERLIERDPEALRPAHREKEPRNLDFSAGSHYWHFSRFAEYASYALDQQITYAGKASLAITLHKPFTSGQLNILSQERFLADHYRGQRLRLVAYVKVENMQQPLFTLHVSGSANHISPLSNSPVRSQRLTHSRITPPAAGSDWARHELVIDVPDDAYDIGFSLDTREQGKTWLGGLHIEIVDQHVPLTGTILRPPPRQPLNQDFSNGLEYWSVEESTLWRYEYGIEESMTPHAASCAYLKATDATPGDSCVLQQMINMEEHKGQHIRFQAILKTQDVEPQASLFIGSLLAGIGGERVEEIIKDTNEWTLHTLLWHIPQEQPLGFALLSFGVALHGTGQVWLTGVHLEVIEDH